VPTARRRNPSALHDQVEKQVKARMQRLIDEDDERTGQRDARRVGALWEGRDYPDLYGMGVITKEQEKALWAEDRASFAPESRLYTYNPRRAPARRRNPSNSEPPVSSVAAAIGPDPLWSEGVNAVAARLVHAGRKPGGSLPGFLARDPETGRKVLVKLVRSEDHAKNETLAGALYRALGINAPDLRWTTHTAGADGRASILSPWMEGYEEVHDYTRLGAADLAALARSFPADAWLANWDTVGLEFDNLLFAPQKRGALRWSRIDPGGALIFRAMGAPKGKFFGEKVGEFDTLVNAGMNPTSYHVFAEAADVHGNVDKMVPTVADILTLVQHGYVEKAARWAGFDATISSDLAALMRARAIDLAQRVEA